MARITDASLRATHPVLGEILDGDFDGKLLEDLQHAIAMRKKIMFRKGAKVRMVGTTNVQLEGKIGEVIKVNSTRISVGLGEKDQFGFAEVYNIPPRMLEVV
jgi:hypothetical protein